MLSLRKYLQLKLSALHSRVLGLFNTLPDSNYWYWIDNLHNSLNFIIYSLKYKAHIIVEGIYQSGGRSFLDIAKQEEVRGEENIRSDVSTTKVAELIIEGINEIIVATSVYDSKPVYFLRSPYEEIR